MIPKFLGGIKMKRKIAAIMMTATLAAALTACGDKAVVEDLSKVTLKDIEKANAGSALLDNHDTVKYKMEIHEEGSKMTEEAMLTEDDGEYGYVVKVEDSENYRNEVFKDGYVYSEYGSTAGLEYAVCWFMEGEYDKYLEESTEAFLVAGTDGLEITDVLEEEGYVSVTAQLDEGDNISTEYDFFYEYVMDKTSLEINQFVAYAKDASDEQSISSFAEITYDEEYSEPSFVNKLQKEESKRTVTVVVDPGKKSEKKIEVEIAAYAIFDAVLSDGYELYSDKDGEDAFTIGDESPDDKGNYSDMTLYAIKN